MSQQQLSVLIVDDSAAVRAAFSAIIKADQGLALFGTAGDPFQAADLMRSGLPDVILLDLELPKMDGLAFLKRIMVQRPLPVVVCSSHTDSGSRSAMKALDLGAAEVLTKPRWIRRSRGPKRPYGSATPCGLRSSRVRSHANASRSSLPVKS